MRYSTSRYLLVILPVVFSLLAYSLLFAPYMTSAAPLSAGSTYFVSPNGNDGNDGRSQGSAFKTIQKGLDVAQPGDTVNLLAGTYSQDAVSRRNGTSSAPITVTGPSDAVVKGGGNARIFEINHDYMVLNGFTIDGQNGSTYRDKLLYVHGAEARNGVSNLIVRGMTLKNAGGECLRLRYFVQKAEIANNTIGPCGRDDFPNGVWAGGGKNGEGVYVGTAPEQLGDGKNPTSDPDQSNENWVHHNKFNTQGNECVDIKETATRNLVEYNDCTGQKDENSGGFDARGSGNIFRYNVTYNNLGVGIRLGGDSSSDGTNTDIYGNTIRDNKQGGIKFQVGSQGVVCGNTMSGNTGGNSVGSYGGSFSPTNTCPSSVPGGQPTTQPTQAPTQQPTQNTPSPTKQPTQATSTPSPTAQPTQPTQPTQSMPSPTAQPTQPPSNTGTTKVYLPILDTYVNSDSSGSSYGSKDAIKNDLTPEQWALIKFQVPTGQQFSKATLKLYVENGSDKGGRVIVATGDWNEQSTWKNRPSLGATIGELGKASSGKFITIDVTQAVRNSTNGIVSLAILPTSKDSAGYTSREGDKSDVPQLIIES